MSDENKPARQPEAGPITAITPVVRADGHDRFDDIPAYTTQHGRHRVDFQGPSSNNGLIWIILIGGLALAVGVFSFILLPQLTNSGGLDLPGIAQPSENDTVEDSEPNDTLAGSSQDTESLESPSGASSETGPAEEAEASPSPSSENVNYELPVGVYNATDIAGYAGTQAALLSESGFNVTTTGNWAGAPVATTTVYHQEDPETAQAIADALDGGAVVEQTYNIPEGVSVVLAQ